MKRRRVVAFLMALAATGLNVPMTLPDSNSLVAYANDSVQGISISSQPEDYQGPEGGKPTFSVVATGGETLHYQWQYSSNGGGRWSSFSVSSRPTAATPNFTLKVDNRFDGWLFRCKVTDDNGNEAYSDTSSISIVSPITLTNPESTTITPTSSATFIVTATGTGDLTYDWESSVDNGTTWSAISGANAATLTVAGSDAVNGTQYRCTVSDAYGQSKTSEPATLTVESASNQCGDNLTYTYKNGTLTISGEGEMWSYTDAESSPFHELDIDTLVIEDGVTVIGTHAFEGNNIQTVVLPESVFSIRHKAFWGNDNLDITIENIGCGIYDKSLPDNATVRGYSNSSAYHSSQGENQTFINLDDDSAFNASTNKIVLTVGDTYQIEAAGSNLRYYSFNPDIVTVDNNGLVSAVAVDEYDRDAKVMVYDKAGRSTVYYFAVVDEKTAPDYSWRYTIISPACWEQTVFVPFWGERISLNEDIAHIVDWDYASPTGTFGTAPIISADDRGNAYIFYYTYDADIRPIKADETYTEETYQITEDWQNAFYKPYYSYTAEEDTRVYFKAYGEYDLDVAVYDTPGGKEIAGDWDGGRAEVSFDVAAGQTVYIHPTASQNQAFTYTMNLSASAIDTVEMIDNETYTINPDTAGDLTTFAFTAPEAGTYLIEGKSNKQFYYQIANNTDFTNVEYDEYGYQLTNSANWSETVYSFSNSILPYYAWINAGETVYIRGWFDEDAGSDALISLRAHAVTAPDTELIVNDEENPNVLSLNPDDFDCRTLVGKEGVFYVITTDSTDVDIIVWDKDWNVLGFEHAVINGGYHFMISCEENQIYHVMAIPLNASDNYGTVNVCVVSDEPQTIPADSQVTIIPSTVLGYNILSFTAPADGRYLIATDSTCYYCYDYANDKDMNDLRCGTLYRNDPDRTKNYYDTLSKDQTVYLRFSVLDGFDSEDLDIHIRISQVPEAEVLMNDMNNSATISINPLDNQRVVFIPAQSGTYYFTADGRATDSAFIFTAFDVDNENETWIMDDWSGSNYSGNNGFAAVGGRTYMFCVEPATHEWNGEVEVTFANVK